VIRQISDGRMGSTFLTLNRRGFRDGEMQHEAFK
jgi:hypothetical protein